MSLHCRTKSSEVGSQLSPLLRCVQGVGALPRLKASTPCQALVMCAEAPV